MWSEQQAPPRKSGEVSLAAEVQSIRATSEVQNTNEFAVQYDPNKLIAAGVLFVDDEGRAAAVKGCDADAVRCGPCS